LLNKKELSLQNINKKYLNMKFLKGLLEKLLDFTTGLGFYGIGLIVVALLLTFFFGWGTLPAGLVGAFVFKNYQTLVKYVKDLFRAN
jgi:hypothetical protein